MPHFIATDLGRQILLELDIYSTPNGATALRETCKHGVITDDGNWLSVRWALDNDWIREATREEVLVYGLRGKKA